jgi:DNA-3-methyladenine glycosylase II
VGSYTPPTPGALAEARARLVQLDPALETLHAALPPFEWRVRQGGFAGMARFIVDQQVSLASAAAIWSRVEAGLGGEVTGAGVLGHEAGLAGLGLSRPKIRYLTLLAEAERDGRIDFAALGPLGDAEAIAALTALTGIGRWTAEVYLMFCEGRLDVFPAADIALQEAMRWIDRADSRPAERAAYARAELWRPYRGVAAHLLWAAYRAVKAGEIVL